MPQPVPPAEADSSTDIVVDISADATESSLDQGDHSTDQDASTASTRTSGILRRDSQSSMPAQELCLINRLHSRIQEAIAENRVAQVNRINVGARSIPSGAGISTTAMSSRAGVNPYLP